MTNKSIPVIGTAIVNGIHWLHRLIESIDYPVDTFVIFDNNGRGELVEELDSLAKIEHTFINKIVVCHMPSNIGVSGAWNLIIKSYVMAPYWIIVNHDVAFTPGLLQEMVTAAEDSEVGMVHPNAGDFNIGSYDLFLIKDWVIRDYGLFDENLYPAYCEDSDYIMRLVHRPIKAVKGLTRKYYHGETTDYEVSGMQTMKADPSIEAKLQSINLINFEYMNQKWGERWRTCWPHVHPFNIESNSIKMTTYDIEYVRKKHLGF